MQKHTFLLGPQLFLLEIWLAFVGIFVPCCGKKVKGGVDDTGFIDQLEFLFNEIEETCKHYDLSPIHKIDIM